MVSVLVKIFAALCLCLLILCATDHHDLTITVTAIKNIDVSKLNLHTLSNKCIVQELNDMECQCAVFNSETPSETHLPILTHAPVIFDCDGSCEEKCLKLCATLTLDVQDRVPKLMCSILGHYNGLKASVHSRTCGTKKWTYTGLISPVICCHDNDVIACKDQIPSSSHTSDPITKED